MKKRRILSLFLSLSLCAGLFTLPASAGYVFVRGEGTTLDGRPNILIQPDPEAVLFFEENQNTFRSPDYRQDKYWIDINNGFEDGWRPTLAVGTDVMYMDKDFVIHDINRGRYSQTYSFSEGYVCAVKDRKTVAEYVTYCYVDKQGNEVFQQPEGCCPLATYNFRENFLGAVKNGRVCVLRNMKDVRHNNDPSLPDNEPVSLSAVAPFTAPYDPPVDPKYANTPTPLQDVQYAYIDTTGAFVTDWITPQSQEEILDLPLYTEHGVSLRDWVSFADREAKAISYDEYKELCQPKTQYPEHYVTYPDGTTSGANGPGIQGDHPNTTYGQAQAQFVGYTIDPANLYSGRGDMVILLTNNTPNWDEGDLFHLFYGLYSEKVYEDFWNIVDSTTEFLPTGDIRQIHYELAPWEVKYLYVATPYVINEEGKLLWRGFEDLYPHWEAQSRIREARTVFLQAETPAECDKLVWFLKRAHDYPEMELTYTPYNGVTLLGVPYPNLRNKAYLDQVLAPFTSQF